MNSLRRQIRGKSQAELVAMRDSVAHEPVNMDDFLQARLSSSMFHVVVLVKLRVTFSSILEPRMHVVFRAPVC